MQKFPTSKKQEELKNIVSNMPFSNGDLVLIDKSINHLFNKSKDYSYQGSFVEHCEDDSFCVVNVGGIQKMVEKSLISHPTNKVGVDPFTEDYQLYIVGRDITSLLYCYCGYKFSETDNKYVKYYAEDLGIPEMTFEPLVKDKQNNLFCYQRDYCWTAEQNKMFIHSLYRSIPTGVFCWRERKWNDVMKMKDEKRSDVAFKEMVDGKQRFKCILDFINDEFCDFHGNYFSDFSDEAKKKFMRTKVNTAILNETTTDFQMLQLFLNINSTGTQMEMSHIENIKNKI